MGALRKYGAAVLVFALALVLRFGFWSEIRGTALDRWHEWDQTDMATYLEQARLFAEVDWLGTDPHHPYHGWQGVAPPEKWLEWYGPHAFHQAPGYSWTLAAASRISGNPWPWIKALQLVLGAGSCVLLMTIATRIGGRIAGISAGLFGAVYAPLFYLEPQLLREGPAVFFLLALLDGLLRHVSREETAGRKYLTSCATIGVSLGLFAIFHEMGSVISLVAAVAVTLNGLRGNLRSAGAGLGALALGYVAGFSPLLARNVAVGASPFAVSCRAHVNFAQANEPRAQNGGSTFSVPGPNVVRILDASGGSLLATIGETWKTYEGDVGLLFSNWMKRVKVIWQSFEEADNTSLYFYRDFTRTLKPLPDFHHAFPLGFAGALMALTMPAARRWRRRRAAIEPEPAEEGSATALRRHGLLLLYLLAVAASLSLVHTVARFRLYLVPFFLVYAGVFVALAVDSARRRRFGTLASLVGCAALGWSLQSFATSPFATRIPRAADFGTAMTLALPADEIDLARRVTERAEHYYPLDYNYHRMLGRAHENRNRFSEAAESYRRALAINPRVASLRADYDRAVRRAGNNAK